MTCVGKFYEANDNQHSPGPEVFITIQGNAAHVHLRGGGSTTATSMKFPYLNEKHPANRNAYHPMRHLVFGDQRPARLRDWEKLVKRCKYHVEKAGWKWGSAKGEFFYKAVPPPTVKGVYFGDEKTTHDYDLY